MNDELSRLLSGELSDAESAHLRARIAADPALAARWEEMCALPAALAGLPPELDGAPPLPRARPVAARRLGWAPVVAVAALAAAVLLAVRGPAPATLTLLDGTELVDGQLSLVAGGVRVEVDGVARLVVTPPAGVTVTVYEGTARLSPGDAPPVEVRAGETRTVGEVERVGAAAEDGEAARRSASEARIAELEAELARLRLENQVASGRLRAHEGMPYEWPPDAPIGFRPAEFEARVRAAAAGVPGTEVVTIDCDEYPCVAVLRATSGAPDWQDQLTGVHRDMKTDPAFGGEVSAFGLALSDDEEKGEPPLNLYGFALVAGKEEDPDLSTRIRFRADGLIQDSVHALRDAP